MYSPVQVANKFIELGVAAGAPITQMQAQKLTYIAHGISLGHRGQSLLTDPVCAWRYGPVVPSLYHMLKQFGSTRINQKVNPYTTASYPLPLDDYANQLITNAFQTYGKYSAEVLSEFTHREGTPWRLTYSAGKTIIDNDLIQNYYERLMAGDTSCIGL